MKREALRIFRQTFSLTYALELIGVIVAMLLFLRRMASSVAVTREDDGSRAASLSAAGLDPAIAVEILSIDGPLFFGAIGAGGVPSGAMSLTTEGIQNWLPPS